MKKRKAPSSTTEPPYFYTPNVATTLALSEEEARHAVSVLRLRGGDAIRVTDGEGHLYSTTIAVASPKEVLLNNLELIPTLTSHTPSLHIALAPTKNIDRLEWAIEKLTEKGVHTIHIVITERAIRRKLSMERLERVVVSALKQSHKSLLPRLYYHASLPQLLATPLPPQLFIAYCGEHPAKANLHQCFTCGEESLFLIGPEGDFTPSEVNLATEQGFKVVSLGTERLRTETASLYAGFLHHILNEHHQNV